jgi:hypothetical protein
MEDGIDIQIIPSALKHPGVTEADIRHAFQTQRYEELMPGEANKFLVLGFNAAGILLEVIYNEVGEEAILVFHAMPCRKEYRKLLEGQNG